MTVYVVLAAAVLLGSVLLWFTFPSASPGVVLANPGRASELSVGIAQGQSARMAQEPRIGADTRSATKASPTAAAFPGVQPRPEVRVRGHDEDPTPDLSDYVNPGEAPSMADVISRLNAAGVYSGLGAFQPPGTRPPLLGLAVPEDFELPPGFVRHYQATDDGQRIEPILMFAPGAQLTDAWGRPYPIPGDRVVPPEMAPTGMPIRTIVVPSPVNQPR